MILSSITINIIEIVVIALVLAFYIYALLKLNHYFNHALLILVCFIFVIFQVEFLYSLILLMVISSFGYTLIKYMIKYTKKRNEVNEKLLRFAEEKDESSYH